MAVVKKAPKKTYGWVYEDETDIRAEELARFSTLAEVEADIRKAAAFGYNGLSPTPERVLVFQMVKSYDIIYPVPDAQLIEVK